MTTHHTISGKEFHTGTTLLQKKCWRASTQECWTTSFCLRPLVFESWWKTKKSTGSRLTKPLMIFNRKLNQLLIFYLLLQMIRSYADRDRTKLRHLLKISAKPGAVAVTADSQLIVGCSRGRLVAFNLNQLMPPRTGKHRLYNEISPRWPTLTLSLPIQGFTLCHTGLTHHF